MTSPAWLKPRPWTSPDGDVFHLRPLTLGMVAALSAEAGYPDLMDVLQRCIVTPAGKPLFTTADVAGDMLSFDLAQAIIDELVQRAVGPEDPAPFSLPSHTPSDGGSDWLRP